MKLDLAEFASIDAFVNEIREEQIDIHAFVNNAGVFHQPDKKTADGFELVTGTNYIGVYYLSEKLLPYLETLPHEVVYINTVSMIHKIAKVDYDDFYCSKHYGNLSVYARSKLCLAKYSYHLAQLYKNTNIKVYMSHPGITITPLGMNAFGKIVKRLSRVCSGFFNSTEKSSLSLAFIMSNDIPAGSIIGPYKFFGGWGYPKQNRILRKVKEGSEELIEFTDKEIKKSRA